MSFSSSKLFSICRYHTLFSIGRYPIPIYVIQFNAGPTLSLYITLVETLKRFHPIPHWLRRRNVSTSVLLVTTTKVARRSVDYLRRWLASFGLIWSLSVEERRPPQKVLLPRKKLRLRKLGKGETG